MSVKIRCLKCKDIIESKHVHDFKFCSCENIFIDGGNEYVRYGGKALEDGSAEFILKNGKVKNILGKYENPFHGVGGNTKIGLVRRVVEDPMYIDIEKLDQSKSYEIHGSTSGEFKKLISVEIKKSREKLQTYKYIFTNDCSRGKLSFGTEEDLIATPNCPILKLDGTVVCLDHLKEGDEVLSIKRITHTKDVSRCVSKLLYSYKYYKEYVYNILFIHNGTNFCADGFFVEGVV